MADANNASVENPLAAIGSRYSVPYPIELVIVRKRMREVKFRVTDQIGQLMFKVKRKLPGRGQRVLIDSAGNHVVTLERKIITAHSRWEVYRGDSTSPKDLILSARRSAAIQLGTKLQVFYANNIGEEICDFRLEGSWSEGFYFIHDNESPTRIADMQRMATDSLRVTVNAGVNYALVVSLIVILDEIIN
ncbi:hypothetical protein NMG60_11035966 [Bertholletia excelsa]